MIFCNLYTTLYAVYTTLSIYQIPKHIVAHFVTSASHRCVQSLHCLIMQNTKVQEHLYHEINYRTSYWVLIGQQLFATVDKWTLVNDGP